MGQGRVGHVDLMRKAPNIPIDKAAEAITKKGGSLHADGEEGFR